MRYSKDGVVRFNPENHTYWNGDKQLTSVTTYLSQFKVPFDSGRISAAYAKKHRLDQQEVLAMWKEKADKATTMGTAVHKVFEDYHEKGIIPNKGRYPKEEVAVALIKEYFESGKLTIVDVEMIVYDDERAGQIDCIVKDQEGNHFILDWKTNAEIKMEGFRGQRMLSKFSFLEDCAYSHYSIQLATYKSMCSEYDIKDCYIIHIVEDGWDSIPILDIDKFL